MPKSSQQQSLHCQQADDFTVVTTTPSEANKENLGRNYHTLSQAIALERLQQLRMVELESAIFMQAFHLIESFYRPPSELAKSVTLQAKRKRRSKSEPKTVTDTSGDGHHTLGVLLVPRKRIHGLCKAYKAEYSSKMGQPAISKRFGAFHHDLDWQLVFAPATDFPTNGINLAKELNFDSLFDYEDAIATTANLLSIARQHSDLIDGLVLCPGANSKSILTEYIPDQINHGGSNEFQKLIVLVEKLIQQKKDKSAQLMQNENCKDDNSRYLLANWFKCEKSAQDNSKQPTDWLEPTQPNLKEMLKEISAWEEFVDVVEISTK